MSVLAQTDLCTQICVHRSADLRSGKNIVIIFKSKKNFKNPLVTAAQDAVGGGIAGGALGAAGGAVEKAVRGQELKKFKDSNYIKEIGKKNVVKK